jgi:hypothetical protein
MSQINTDDKTITQFNIIGSCKLNENVYQMVAENQWKLIKSELVDMN